MGASAIPVVACVALSLGTLAYAADAARSTTPSFAELEARGATIGTIRVDAGNIFDLDDPEENNSFFRLTNRLHIGTRPAVIERSLLFKPGERVSVQRIDETERILRKRRYLYDVDIVPVAYHDGVVDIQVRTRDTWTLDVAGQFSRSGGTNTSSFGLKEYNILGTGATLGISQVSDVDRKGHEFEVSYPHAFDGWTELSAKHAKFDDGSRKTFSVNRPFYALDARWAALATADDDDRTDSIYNAGDVIAKFRHRRKVGELSGGWSRGLVGRWTQRYTVGVIAQDDSYARAVDEPAPAIFPVDHKVRGPVARYQLLEDRFVRTRNRDQIARTEFVSLGLNLEVEATRAMESWGSSSSAWLYSVKVSDGYSFSWGHDLLATAVADRRIGSTGRELDHQGTLWRYYGPQNPAAAFYGSIAFDRVHGAAAPDLLELGGDTGLRGYPLRYQQGDKRALLTLEQRYYTDWYLFRMVRIGGAMFYDHGRAWGGVNPNLVNGRWLRDAGIGLRLSLDRTAFANVLHADIAVPLDRAPGIKGVQYLVKTHMTF